MVTPVIGAPVLAKNEDRIYTVEVGGSAWTPARKPALASLNAIAAATVNLVDPFPDVSPLPEDLASLPDSIHDSSVGPGFELGPVVRARPSAKRWSPDRPVLYGPHAAASGIPRLKSTSRLSVPA